MDRRFRYEFSTRFECIFKYSPLVSSVFSIFSTRFECSFKVLDFALMSSSQSVRAYLRIGSSVSMFTTSRFGRTTLETSGEDANTLEMSGEDAKLHSK
jgi:hypothetical protein